MPAVPLIIEPDPDESEFATVLVDATIAGRDYRLVLDTGAPVTQLDTDDYLADLAPVGADDSSGTFGRRVTDPLVRIPDLIVGGDVPVDGLDVRRSESRSGSVLGMDVLGRYCCQFQLDARTLLLDSGHAPAADRELLVSNRGHVYVDVSWPGITARACWDTGAGPTLVNEAFWRAHAELFTSVGTLMGTDSNGDQSETPLLMMAGPVIGGRTFTAHKVVAVDLAGVNATIEHPMDLIVGYPTIRQADWLFDFPARRWTLTR
jgi:hypothetical protein